MTEAELLELIDCAEREAWTELELGGLELRKLPDEIGRLLDAVEFLAGEGDQVRKTIYNISGDYFDIDKIEGSTGVVVGLEGQTGVDLN